jgi:hypothetical protein
MKKTIVISILAFGMSVSWLSAQLSPGRYMSPIRQDPNRPVTSTAPAAPSATAHPVVSQKPLVSPLITAIDTNHNGILEAAEIVNAPAALKTLDKNGDGKLTADEYLGQGESPTSPLVKALDANADGVIDATEIAGAGLALRMIDKNGDGKLTPSEFRPVRAPATSVSGASSLSSAGK